MTSLARQVGIGLAARGSVSDTVRWAERARATGLDSIWFHDSYFERDAVTYASAVASQVPEIGVGLGSLNPYTRHPVLIAMTVSAIDEMAPKRVRLGLGSALPLRLGQMGIPYAPPDAVHQVERAIADVRALWRGERLPAGAPNLPELQPMFPPVHHTPIYVAGYRTPMVQLAGRVADGYLARPAESLGGLRAMLEKMRAAAVAAGRPADAVHVAGYLLTMIDDTRRDALNRAKREPFVIYMMSILSDMTMKRAGIDTSVRDAIAAAWRAEEYHRAAEMIPDELLDAFLLCGTRSDVAARADMYRVAGMDLPLLQPIVQEDAQVEAVLDAAVIYGEQRATSWAPAAATDEPAGVAPAIARERLPLGARLRRHAGAWAEIARPFSFTASVVPVAAAAALASITGRLNWTLALLACAGSLLLHVGTNVTNEIYDVRKGIDTITSPRMSRALLKGRMTEREAFTIVGIAFAGAIAIGVALLIARGWPVVALGIAGLVGGFGYTAPPLQYKFRAVGLPIVFALMGPLMVVGAYYVITGTYDGRALAISVPVGLLVAAILHGNEWRDISDDARTGGRTFSIIAGRKVAHIGYVTLVVGAYLALAVAVVVRALPPASALAILSLPLLVRALRASELGASGQQRAIAMIDLQTAQLHAAFGALLVAGLFIAAAVR